MTVLVVPVTEGRPTLTDLDTRLIAEWKCEEVSSPITP